MKNFAYNITIHIDLNKTMHRIFKTVLKWVYVFFLLLDSFVIY